MSEATVGLTGGMASGKSTVAGWLAEVGGYLVVDADYVVAELYQPGAFGAAVVRELFGDAMLAADGSVNRPALAERVFGDSAARERLEAAIHPLVRSRFAEIAGSVKDVAILEATLLVEAGYAPDFDLVVTVEADDEIRLERAVERGLDRSAAEARMRAQGDGALRRAAADVVISNDEGLEELRAQVDALIDRIERLRSAA